MLLASVVVANVSSRVLPGVGVTTPRATTVGKAVTLLVIVINHARQQMNVLVFNAVVRVIWHAIAKVQCHVAVTVVCVVILLDFVLLFLTLGVQQVQRPVKVLNLLVMGQQQQWIVYSWHVLRCSMMMMMWNLYRRSTVRRRRRCGLSIGCLISQCWLTKSVVLMIGSLIPGPPTTFPV